MRVAGSSVVEGDDLGARGIVVGVGGTSGHPGQVGQVRRIHRQRDDVGVEIAAIGARRLAGPLYGMGHRIPQAATASGARFWGTETSNGDGDANQSSDGHASTVAGSVVRSMRRISARMSPSWENAALTG